MSFDRLSRRLLPLILVLLIGSLTLTTTGCSWFKKRNRNQSVPALNGGADSTLPPSDLGAGDQNSGLAMTPEEFAPEANIRDIHFDYDKSDLRSDQLAILDANIKYFQKNADVKIYVEGHTDERGTVEYNLALGQRRAASVQEYMISHGIAADRIATASKGEEEPLNPAKNESAYAQNRRVHFKKLVK